MCCLLAAGTVSATSTAKANPLMEARMAAVDGDHAKCAKLADKARRIRGATWHAHRVYASCTVFAADARKKELGAAAYKAEIKKAVDALKLLFNTPDIYMQQDTANGIRLMVDELSKRLN